MAEAIISRASSGINVEIMDQIQNPIYPTAGRCMICIKAVTEKNQPISNINISCQDGDRNWNYTTNEFGKVLFSTNNGQCNITAYNYYINGVKFIDANMVSKNFDAPIGTVINSTLVLPSPQKDSIMYLSNASYTFLVYNTIDINMSGGGGGGGWSNYGKDRMIGWSGGNGYTNIQNNIYVSPGTVYNIIVGGSGSGGHGPHYVYPGGSSWEDGDTWIRPSTSGGTTSAFGFVAVGGSAGRSYVYCSDIYNFPFREAGGNGAVGGTGACGGMAGSGDYYNGYSGSSGWCYITFK